MSGVDYLDALVYGETKYLNKKYKVSNKTIEIIVERDEKLRIQSLLIKWLESKGLRHDISKGQ